MVEITICRHGWDLLLSQNLKSHRFRRTSGSISWISWMCHFWHFLSQCVTFVKNWTYAYTATTQQITHACDLLTGSGVRSGACLIDYARVVTRTRTHTHAQHVSVNALVRGQLSNSRSSAAEHHCMYSVGHLFKSSWVWWHVAYTRDIIDLHMHHVLHTYVT